MSEDIEKLHTAFEMRDAQEVERLAHGCAGASANCGMVAVIAPLREIERLGHEGQLAMASDLAAQMRKEFDRIRLFLHERLERVMA